MRKILPVYAFLFAAAIPCHAQRGALDSGTYAIVNANVITMTSPQPVRDATVLVRDGRIAAVGPARSVTVPNGTRRIDANGGWLIPGLADMHTHLYSDGAVHDSAGPAELGVILANGVTTARLMIGTPEHLVLRKAVADGSVVGPQLWVSSPQFTGRAGENASVVATPDAARAAVRAAKSAGYDFIKLTMFISPEVYDAITAEAKASNIRVVGHVEVGGLEKALAAGQQIEHLDAYLEAALADSAPSKTSLTQGGVFRVQNWASMDHIDNAKVVALGRATAQVGVWSVPTLHVFNTAFALGETDAEITGRADWNMIPPDIRGGYMNARTRYWQQPVAPAHRQKYAATRNALAKAIHEAGGRIMAGSDSPEWLMAYGWTLHRELEALVKAGLTPYEALTAATVNPAEFLGASREFGTIEAGKRADLVLLRANPLDDIRNTQQISAVAAGGRWLDRAAIDAMIARGTNAIGGAAPR